MADKKTFGYAVTVTVFDVDDPRDMTMRRTAMCIGEVEAEVEPDLKLRGAEAIREATKEASQRGHAGRLMGKVFDDAG